MLCYLVNVSPRNLTSDAGHGGSLPLAALAYSLFHFPIGATLPEMALGRVRSTFRSGKEILSSMGHGGKRTKVTWMDVNGS